MVEKIGGSNLKRDLRGWGVGLLVMGGLHFVLPFLAKEWGMALIPLGLACLFITHRAMYIAIGSGLVMVGLLNLGGSLAEGRISLWSAMGVMQLVWGVKEMRKFAQVGQAGQSPAAAEAVPRELRSPSS